MSTRLDSTTLPQVISALKGEDPVFREWAALVLGNAEFANPTDAVMSLAAEFDIVPEFDWPYWGVLAKAFERINKVNELARPAIAWFVRILAKEPSPYLQWETLTFPITRVAMRGLVTIGDLSVNALQTLVTAPNYWGRLYAVRTLGAVGERSNAVIPILVRMTEDPDPWIRAQACFGLGRSASSYASKAIHALATRMEDPDLCVRAEAWNALQKLGANKNESASMLICDLDRALSAPDQKKCARAATTLSHLGGLAEQVFPSLLKLLTQSGDWAVELSHALSCIAMWNKSLVRLLVDEFLHCTNPVHNFWFLAALSDIVQNHTVEALSFQLEFGQPPSSIRCHPAEIVEEARRVIPLLINQLKEKDIMAYVAFLPRLGAELGPARALLENVIFGKYDPESRSMALRTLVALGISDRDRVVTLDPILLNLLDDPTSQVRLVARLSLLQRAIS